MKPIVPNTVEGALSVLSPCQIYQIHSNPCHAKDPLFTVENPFRACGIASRYRGRCAARLTLGRPMLSLTTYSLLTSFVCVGIATNAKDDGMIPIGRRAPSRRISAFRIDNTICAAFEANLGPVIEQVGLDHTPS